MHRLTRGEVLRRMNFDTFLLVRSSGCQVERRQLVALDRRDQPVADVRQEDTGEHVDVVLGDELPVLGLSDRRVALVVLLDQLDLPSGGLIADLLEGESEALEHVLARLGEDAAQRRHEAHLIGSAAPATSAPAAIHRPSASVASACPRAFPLDQP